MIYVDEGSSEKIKPRKREPTQTWDLREKMKNLEAERTNLLIEIKNLKKMAESKANDLESEVNMLREEVESLKSLLR